MAPQLWIPETTRNGSDSILNELLDEEKPNFVDLTCDAGRFMAMANELLGPQDDLSSVQAMAVALKSKLSEETMARLKAQQMGDMLRAEVQQLQEQHAMLNAMNAALHEQCTAVMAENEALKLRLEAGPSLKAELDALRSMVTEAAHARAESQRMERLLQELLVERENKLAEEGAARAEAERRLEALRAEVEIQAATVLTALREEQQKTATLRARLARQPNGLEKWQALIGRRNQWPWKNGICTFLAFLDEYLAVDQVNGMSILNALPGHLSQIDSLAYPAKIAADRQSLENFVSSVAQWAADRHMDPQDTLKHPLLCFVKTPLGVILNWHQAETESEVMMDDFKCSWRKYNRITVQTPSGEEELRRLFLIKFVRADESLPPQQCALLLLVVMPPKQPSTEATSRLDTSFPVTSGVHNPEQSATSGGFTNMPGGTGSGGSVQRSGSGGNQDFSGLTHTRDGDVYQTLEVAWENSEEKRAPSLTGVPEDFVEFSPPTSDIELQSGTDTLDKVGLPGTPEMDQNQGSDKSGSNSSKEELDASSTAKGSSVRSKVNSRVLSLATEALSKLAGAGILEEECPPAPAASDASLVKSSDQSSTPACSVNTSAESSSAAVGSPSVLDSPASSKGRLKAMAGSLAHKLGLRSAAAKPQLSKKAEERLSILAKAGSAKGKSIALEGQASITQPVQSVMQSVYQAAPKPASKESLPLTDFIVTDKKKRSSDAIRIPRLDLVKPSPPSRRKTSMGSSSMEASEVQGLAKAQQEFIRQLSYKEVQKATSSFKDLLGGQGIAPVYKAVLGGWEAGPAGKIMREMAVKVLRSNNFQSHEGWEAEVLLLGSLHHPNVIMLQAYCMEPSRDVLMLLYDLMPNRSLDHLIDNDKCKQVLTWQQRINVALGAARALDYLHGYNVVHRNFKPSNILLDQNLNAKLADFGLAKLLPGEEWTHASTEVLGSQGYLDPNYMTTGQLRKSSDVYSFGVVLLELLTGRKATCSNPYFDLKSWTSPHLSHRKPDVKSLVDPSLQGDFSLKGAQTFAMLAKSCIADNHKDRPLMCDVVVALEMLS